MTPSRAGHPFQVDESEAVVPGSLSEFSMETAVQKLIVRSARLQSIIEREREQSQQATRQLLLELLEVCDALDRQIGHLPALGGQGGVDGSTSGLGATIRLLRAKLMAVGVRPMELVGKTANPATADIAASEVRPDLPDEIVLSQVTTGYWWGSAVLRRATVVVSGGSGA